MVSAHHTGWHRQVARHTPWLCTLVGQSFWSRAKPNRRIPAATWVSYHLEALPHHLVHTQLSMAPARPLPPTCTSLTQITTQFTQGTTLLDQTPPFQARVRAQLLFLYLPGPAVFCGCSSTMAPRRPVRRILPVTLLVGEGLASSSMGMACLQQCPWLHWSLMLMLLMAPSATAQCMAQQQSARYTSQPLRQEWTATMSPSTRYTRGTFVMFAINAACSDTPPIQVEDGALCSHCWVCTHPLMASTHQCTACVPHASGISHLAVRVSRVTNSVFTAAGQL